MRDRCGSAHQDCAVASTERQVIELRLATPSEMFEVASTDLFSEYRNFLTGVDFCLSELRSRASNRAVHLVITLPESELAEDTAPRISRSLKRYCDHRLTYNKRERRALRYDGIASLRIGLPLVALGIAITIWAAHFGEEVAEWERFSIDHIGWVVAWVGLWYPMDVLFFFPEQYRRETRALRLLHDAEVEVRALTPQS